MNGALQPGRGHWSGRNRQLSRGTGTARKPGKIRACQTCGACLGQRPRRPARRCRIASNSTTAAATETFRLATWPRIGIEARRSQDSRTRRRSPCPSAPSTKADGIVKSIWS